MSTKDKYKTEIRTFGELKAGDRIIGPTGEPVTITHAYDPHIPDKMYEIEMEDGEVIQASGNHLWYCESESDFVNKDEYLRLAKAYFENNVIPAKLTEDVQLPLKEIVHMFGDSIDNVLFIEKACKSLGYSSYTPIIMRDGLYKDVGVDSVYNYSYNDLIEFLHKMRMAVTDGKEYFHFGQVRTTEEIFEISKHSDYVNIPHKGDINNQLKTK